MTEPEVIEGVAHEIVPYRAPAPATLFRSDEPTEIVKRATETAKVLADVVRQQKLTSTISGREHVRVEGWTLLGSMLGVFPVCVWTRKLDNGWEARVEARTRSGEVVGAAEAECLRSERLWADRDDYALRSMAQTRATSKALRQPLGFVMTLAGFDPTPLEEMPAEPDKRAGGPRRGRGLTSSAVGEASSEERAPTPPAPSEESPFKAPTGPRGGKARQLEANELAERLVALVQELGATDSLPKVEEKREAADVAWLRRQIATAEHHLAQRKEGA